MIETIRCALTGCAARLAHPWAFAAVLGYGAAWYRFAPDSFDWPAVATMAIWMMTLFIQRAAYRDTQAIHAKLDELLKADGVARSELVHIDAIEPEEIADHRNEVRATIPSPRR